MTTTNPIKKTSEEWLVSPEFAGIKILDPDGWRKFDNGPNSWYEEKITKEEFVDRLSESTIAWSKE